MLPAGPAPSPERRTIRSVIELATPSVPSEPTKHPGQIVAGSIKSVERAQVDKFSGRQNHFHLPARGVVVKPYLRQWAPPEFSATLPPIVHTDLR